MKVSVSLPEDDVAFLDDVASRPDVGSRSAAVHRAVTVLRISLLELSYEEAWRDWVDEAPLWEPTAADGLADAPR